MIKKITTDDLRKMQNKEGLICRDKSYRYCERADERRNPHS